MLNASLVLPWFLADETDARLDALLLRVRREGAIVPALWPLEVANAMRSAIRLNRMPIAHRDHAMRELAALHITLEAATQEFAWGPTLALSDQHGLTLHDAGYLELARRRRLPLASLDADLRAAAASKGVISLPA